MDQEEIVSDWENRARRAGISITMLCRKAGIAQSTFSRWKKSHHNPKPTSLTLASATKVERALSAIERGLVEKSGQMA